MYIFKNSTLYSNSIRKNTVKKYAIIICHQFLRTFLFKLKSKKELLLCFKRVIFYKYGVKIFEKEGILMQQKKRQINQRR